MKKPSAAPTGNEVRFGENEIIVSKTDLRGIITYANPVFVRVSGYSVTELVGSPHNLVRHPDMPRCVFHLLWERLKAGHEVFAYVNNLARSGDHYWVFAHVTPSFDPSGNVVGYHSSRRVPYPDALSKVKELYAQLLKAEKAEVVPTRGLEAGRALLDRTLRDAGMAYDPFVFGLSQSTRLESLAA